MLNIVIDYSGYVEHYTYEYKWLPMSYAMSINCDNKTVVVKVLSLMTHLRATLN